MACSAPLPPSPRQLQALALRRQGLTFVQIGVEMGISPHRVRTLVSEGLARVPFEDAEEVRKIELERLDALWEVAWEKVKEGQLAAVDRCLRVMERRAALLGLDAAKRSEVHMFDGDAKIGSEIRALLAGRSFGENSADG